MVVSCSFFSYPLLEYRLGLCLCLFAGRVEGKKLRSLQISKFSFLEAISPKILATVSVIF